MNEEEIFNFFKNEKRFLGVFALDELVSVKLEIDSGLIFNTSPRIISDGHWISIYKNKNNDVYFLDSLNLEFMLSHPYVTNFFKYNNIHHVKKMCFPLQPSNSRLCGLYCIYFIKCFFKNVFFNKLVNVFNIKNLHENDFIVSNYVINAIK